MSEKNKRISINILSAIAIICALFFVCKFTQEKNVYAISYDEECVLSSWSASGISLSVDNSYYYQGASSLHCVDNTLSGTSVMETKADKRFEVTGGNIYEVSAFVSSYNCSSDVTLKLNLNIYTDKTASTKKYTLQGTTYSMNASSKVSPWTKVITRLAVPDNVTYYASFNVITENGFAEFWMDKFTCMAVETDNELIIEYDDMSAVSSYQHSTLRKYQYQQSVGEWTLESSVNPSNDTSFIVSTNEYIGDTSTGEKDTAICLNVYKNQGSAYIVKRITTLFENNVYRVSGHYKTSGNQIYTYAGIKFYDYYGNHLSDYDKSVTLPYSGTSNTSANEMEFSFTFTAPSCLYAKIYLGCPEYKGSNNSMSFYFNDLKISLVKYGNLIRDLSGMGTTSTLSFDVENYDSVHNYAIKMELGNNKQDAVHSYIYIPGGGVQIQKDKEYVLSYDVKITQKGIFSPRVIDTKGQKVEFFTTETVGRTLCDWTHVEKTFSYSYNTALSQILFKNFAESGTMTVYLDNIKLTTSEEYEQVSWNKQIEVKNVSSPFEIKSGSRCYFNMDFTLTDNVKYNFIPRVDIMDGFGNRLTSVSVDCDTEPIKWKIGDNNCNFYFTLPSYLESGSYSVRFDGEQVELSTENNFLFSFDGVGIDNYKTVATVENYNGVPTLMINGSAKSPVMYSYPSTKYSFLCDMDDRLYRSNLELFSTFEGSLKELWLSDGSIDFDKLDDSISRALSYNGNGYLMVNISLYAPTWWLENNKDERALTSDGLYSTGSPKSEQASFSSIKFRQESGEVLERIIDHIKMQKYYGRIFGIKLSSGRTGEWMNYGDARCDDMSSVALTAFKVWCQEKYSSVSALNGSWKTSYSSFDDISFPTIPSSSVYGMVLDSSTQRNIIDYHLFINDVVADSFLHYAKIVKEKTNDEKIVGGYFGYSWFSASYGGMGTEHLGIQKVLESDYIDYIASPISYSMRVLGQSSQFMSAQDSITANGKLYLIEQDNRTSAVRQYTGAWDGASDFGIGRTHTIEDSVFELKRDFANDFINGNAYWYYDMFGDWFDDDQIYNFISESKDIYDESLYSENRSNTSEVALFLSNSLYSYNVDSSSVYALYNSLIRMQKHNLSSMGAPYDVYKTSSLVQGVVPEHKVNIILSAYEIDDEEKQAISTHLKKNGQYIVWIYLTGFSNGSENNLSNLSDLTGFAFDSVYGNLSLEVSLSGSNSVTEGINGLHYGMSSKRDIVRPYITDAKTDEKLGVYSNTSYCAFAMRDMGEWTSIYSGGPNLPSSLLRNILKTAGVHIYSDNNGDIIYANSGYVALHSGTQEKKSVKLNGYYAVYDLFAKKYISFNTNAFEYDHVANDTKIFRLSTPNTFTVKKNIDGKTEYEHTTKNYVFTLPTTEKLFVSWKVGEKYYSVGDCISLDDDTEIFAVTIDYYVENYAQFRLSVSNPGIRFFAKIFEPDRNILDKISETEVKYGMIITCQGVSGFLKIPTVNWRETSAGYCCFASAVTDFPEDSNKFYNDGFIAKAYITITVNGIEHTYYTSPTQPKAVSQMAYSAMSDRRDQKDELYAYYAEEDKTLGIKAGYSMYDESESEILYYFAKHVFD